MDESGVTTLDPPANTAEGAASPSLQVRVRPKTQDTKPKPLPLHAVVLHNDPINGFDWVVGQLMKVLRVNGTRAFWLTLKVQLAGRGIIWTGSLEVAELKADQI